MIVKHGRDQKDCQNEATRDAPAKLKPHRIKGYFFAEPLSLYIAAVEIVRKKCHQRAEKHLKHGRAPSRLSQSVPTASARSFQPVRNPPRASACRDWARRGRRHPVSLRLSSPPNPRCGRENCRNQECR